MFCTSVLPFLFLYQRGSSLHVFFFFSIPSDVFHSIRHTSFFPRFSFTPLLLHSSISHFFLVSSCLNISSSCISFIQFHHHPLFLFVSLLFFFQRSVLYFILVSSCLNLSPICISFNSLHHHPSFLFLSLFLFLSAFCTPLFPSFLLSKYFSLFPRFLLFKSFFYFHFFQLLSSPFIISLRFTSFFAQPSCTPLFPCFFLVKYFPHFFLVSSCLNLSSIYISLSSFHRHLSFLFISLFFSSAVSYPTFSSYLLVLNLPSISISFNHVHHLSLFLFASAFLFFSLFFLSHSLALNFAILHLNSSLPPLAPIFLRPFAFFSISFNAFNSTLFSFNFFSFLPPSFSGPSLHRSGSQLFPNRPPFLPLPHLLLPLFCSNPLNPIF